jgi:hypothetical protein
VTESTGLATGAEARFTNRSGELAAIFLNGGTARPLQGTWSATSELLVTELAPRLPGIRFVEVRYRLKTWKELQSCMDDARAATELTVADGARSCLLVGFSMGGAVSIGIAGEPAVVGVLGLAPWIPERLPLDGLSGKRLDVVHGAWDRAVLGIPGVHPRTSLAAYERASALDVEGSYTVIPRGLHGCAVRRPSGGLFKLPSWRRWVHEVHAALERFQAAQSGGGNHSG